MVILGDDVGITDQILLHFFFLSLKLFFIYVTLFSKCSEYIYIYIYIISLTILQSAMQYSCGIIYNLFHWLLTHDSLSFNIFLSSFFLERIEHIWQLLSYWTTQYELDILHFFFRLDAPQTNMLFFEVFFCFFSLTIFLADLLKFRNCVWLHLARFILHDHWLICCNLG